MSLQFQLISLTYFRIYTAAIQNQIMLCVILNKNLARHLKGEIYLAINMNYSLTDKKTKTVEKEDYKVLFLRV